MGQSQSCGVTLPSSAFPAKDVTALLNHPLATTQGLAQGLVTSLYLGQRSVLLSWLPLLLRDLAEGKSCSFSRMKDGICLGSTRSGACGEVLGSRVVAAGLSEEVSGPSLMAAALAWVSGVDKLR